jgi:hypothetical protein
MESQQMIELRLARLDENAETSQQGMLAMREEMTARMDANTEATLATLEIANEIKEDIQARTKAIRDKRMKANIFFLH